MLIEHRLGYAGGFCDFIHAGRVIAALNEDGPSNGHDLLAPLFSRHASGPRGICIDGGHHVRLDPEGSYPGGVTTANAVLSVRGLTVRYGKARGIDDVSLDVPAGAVTGLLGPNGSGKTTLLRAVLDLVHPTMGSIDVAGTDSRHSSARARIGYLPGDLSFPPRLSGYSLIKRYAAAHGGLDQSRVANLAQRLTIDLSRPVGTLSRGNLQKVGLVLVFGRDTDLLLLDEPTSGLDPLLQREFAALVEESVDRGSAVVLSSHVMSELEDLAQRVAVLREGRLVAVETIDELRRRARQRWRIRLVDSVTATACAKALQVSSDIKVHASEDMVDVTFSGQADGVVKTLAGFTVLSLESVGGELDEVLLDFYSDDRYAPQGAGEK